MFSIITNIYNKKTKGPTLMELFTATGKLKKFFFFLTTRYVRFVHHGWHGTHRYDTRVLAIHVDFCLQTPSFSKLFIPRMNGLVCRRILCIPCTKCTLHSNVHFVWYSNTQNNFSLGAAIFSLYTLIAWRQKCEVRWKTTYWGKKFLSCSLYLHRFHKYKCYSFPIINFCNPGVHYETPCIVFEALQQILITSWSPVWSFWQYLLTYFMEQSLSWEANGFSASQEIPCILGNQKVHYRIHKCPPPVPTLQSISPGPRLSVWIFCNKTRFYGELLAPRPTPKL